MAASVMPPLEDAVHRLLQRGLIAGNAVRLSKEVIGAYQDHCHFRHGCAGHLSVQQPPPQMPYLITWPQQTRLKAQPPLRAQPLQ